MTETEINDMHDLRHNEDLLPIADNQRCMLWPCYRGLALEHDPIWNNTQLGMTITNVVSSSE